jgi:threonine/homoserine/homoserine lactone efflux protein
MRHDMSAHQIVSFLLFAVVAAITPGPSNVMLTAAGANGGVIRGLPALFGVSVGMGLMMLLVSFGLGSLVLHNPVVLKILNWCGAVFLLWLAWRIATASTEVAPTDAKAVGFLGAAGFQWINPKSWLVCTSAAGTYLQASAGSPILQSVMIGGLFLLAALPSCFLWLALGATAHRFLGGGRRLRVFNITMGALLALSIVLILVH